MHIRLSFRLALLAAALVPAAALAHHSFAVFFDSQKSITITGVVTEFKFVNPHGVIVLQVKNANGVAEEWKVETNSPSILRRRGWGPDSLTAGETVTIEGWPGRNDAHYARLRSAKRANGEPVGKPFDPEG
ncbi:MAG TPA: DUF6152 family protein [Steroidobacteraceae bacterium]|nr:DUF6152 family protein [Steroidobacteraceae bacterium]